MRVVVGAIGMLCMFVGCSPPQYAVAPTPQPGIVINGASYPALERGRKPKTVVPPQYPDEAFHKQIEGFVDFEFTIQPDGSVADPKVTKEFPEHQGFAKNAEKVFGQFTFAPDVVNGVPVATPAQYRMAFKMH